MTDRQLDSAVVYVCAQLIHLAVMPAFCRAFSRRYQLVTDKTSSGRWFVRRHPLRLDVNPADEGFSRR